MCGLRVSQRQNRFGGGGEDSLVIGSGDLHPVDLENTSREKKRLSPAKKPSDAGAPVAVWVVRVVSASRAGREFCHERQSPFLDFGLHDGGCGELAVAVGLGARGAGMLFANFMGGCAASGTRHG